MRVQIFGHPYAPIGMGEQLASFSKALDAVHIEHGIYDIYQSNAKLKQNRPWLIAKESKDINAGDINIFHINGDEIENCLAHLKTKGFDFSKGKNIIIPAWELENYPKVWQDGINKFDEVWTISHFVKKIFSASWVKPTVRYVGQSAEREKGVCYPKKYFGIKDSSLVFLGFFDQSSYFTRKNPYALLEFYKKMRKKYPYSDFQLVLKVKNINQESDLKLDKIDENVVLINQNLSYDETTSLLDSCDIFVSLHRSEGFGRGAAEAILRNKRAIITNYSGVEDYSKDKAVIPVSYNLVNVQEGEYPYYENQVWAEPDIDEAVEKASSIINEWENGITNAHFFEKNLDAGDIVKSVATHFSVGINILNNLSGE